MDSPLIRNDIQTWKLSFRLVFLQMDWKIIIVISFHQRVLMLIVVHTITDRITFILRSTRRIKRVNDNPHCLRLQMQNPIVEYFKVDQVLYIPKVIAISEWNVWGKVVTWRAQFVTYATILNVKAYLLKLNITINSNSIRLIWFDWLVCVQLCKLFKRVHLNRTRK
jgi:hypothetical protein